MRKTARLLAAVPLVASLVCAMAVAAHAAPAAAAPLVPGWRIVAAFPQQSTIESLAVSGPDSAWAAGYCAKPCGSSNGVLLRHWNGRAWHQMPQPAVAGHAGAHPQPMLVTAPGSPAVWAVYNTYDKKVRASAVEWTGTRWAHTTVFPVGVNLQGFAAAGPSDIRAFGLASEFSDHQYAARWNGKSWSQAPSPGPTGLGPWTAAARSANDIWAQSIATNGRGLAVSRWNGTRWVKQAVPPAPKGVGGTTGGLSGDLAVSGGNVWSYGYFAFKTGSTVDWLVHWNGQAWSNVRVPYALNKSIMAGPLGSDGHGGAWFAATPAGTGREYLYHVSAAGQWGRVPIPTLRGATGTVISGFAAIPGSTSVYAYGEVAHAGSERGVILKFGA